MDFTMAMRPILTLPPAAPRPERREVEVVSTLPRLAPKERIPRLPVNFDFVPGSQRDMHDRLLNWCRSLTSRPHQEVAAGFSLVKTDAWEQERRPYGAGTATPLDPKDAQRIAMAVAAMAQDARNDGFRRAKALDWYYRLKCRAARAMADEMHLSVHGLADTVIAARQALIERLTPLTVEP